MYCEYIGLTHRLDITESASAQFPIWISNFGPYWQLRAVKEKIFNNFELLLCSVFYVFLGKIGKKMVCIDLGSKMATPKDFGCEV